MKRVWGAAAASPVSSPPSVTTMTSGSPALAAQRIIWLVENTWSASALTSGLHSGCAITGAPGCAALASSTISSETWSWIGQHPSHTVISTSGSCAAIHRPRFRSGPKRTRGAPRERTTSTALAEVQQTSVSALTSADEFTYITTGTPGFSAFHAASCSAVIMSAIGQPASARGSNTVLPGARMAAVSAMKRTPASTITSAPTVAARRASSRESPTTSATACTSAR